MWKTHHPLKNHANHSWCGKEKSEKRNGRKERSALLCLLDRAYLQTHTTPYTNLLIDLRILKSFLIFFHTYCGFGTNRITRCAATAVFFSGEKNRYIFHCVFSFFIIFFYSTILLCPPHFFYRKSRNENVMRMDWMVLGYSLPLPHKGQDILIDHQTINLLKIRAVISLTICFSFRRELLPQYRPASTIL